MGTTTRTALLLLSAALAGCASATGPSPQLLDARAICQQLGQASASSPELSKRRLRRPVHDRARIKSPRAMIRCVEGRPLLGPPNLGTKSVTILSD